MEPPRLLSWLSIFLQSLIGEVDVYEDVLARMVLWLAEELQHERLADVRPAIMKCAMQVSARALQIWRQFFTDSIFSSFPYLSIKISRFTKRDIGNVPLEFSTYTSTDFCLLHSHHRILTRYGGKLVK